jgi:hypothetical protein
MLETKGIEPPMPKEEAVIFFLQQEVTKQGR